MENTNMTFCGMVKIVKLSAEKTCEIYLQNWYIL